VTDNAVVDLTPTTTNIGLDFPVLGLRNVAVVALADAVCSRHTSHASTNSMITVVGDAATLVRYAQAQHVQPSPRPDPGRGNHALLASLNTARSVHDGKRWLRGNTEAVYPWFGKDIRDGIPLAVENYGLLRRLWQEDVADWEGKYRTALQASTSTPRPLDDVPSLDVEVLELRPHAHDLMKSLLAGFASPNPKRVLDTAAGAGGLIAVTPMFRGSYSGLLKSFFDVLDDEALLDKPVLIGATAGSARHSLALVYGMRPMFAYLRAVVLPTSVFTASEEPRSRTGAPTPAKGALRSGIDRAGRGVAVQINLRPAGDHRPAESLTPFEQLLDGD
jgi:FMN reductase